MLLEPKKNHTWKSENTFFICFLDARAFPSTSSAHICLLLRRRLLPIATINHNENCDGKECQLCNDNNMYCELLSPTRHINAHTQCITHTLYNKIWKKSEEKTQRKAIWIRFIIHDAVYSDKYFLSPFLMNLMCITCIEGCKT